jgi:hypothetical protein
MNSSGYIYVFGYARFGKVDIQPLIFWLQSRHDNIWLATIANNTLIFCTDSELLYEVDIRFIDLGIVENKGVALGNSRISLSVLEISLEIHLLPVWWPPFAFPVPRKYSTELIHVSLTWA